MRQEFYLASRITEEKSFGWVLEIKVLDEHFREKSTIRRTFPTKEECQHWETRARASLLDFLTKNSDRVEVNDVSVGSA